MVEINGHVLYGEQDIVSILYRLNFATVDYKEQIKRHVLCSGYGADARALIKIIDDPIEYNIDYLNSLDSAVTEQFIQLMILFRMA